MGVDGAELSTIERCSDSGQISAGHHALSVNPATRRAASHQQRGRAMWQVCKPSARRTGVQISSSPKRVRLIAAWIHRGKKSGRRVGGLVRWRDAASFRRTDEDLAGFGRAISTGCHILRHVLRRVDAEAPGARSVLPATGGSATSMPHKAGRLSRTPLDSYIKRATAGLQWPRAAVAIA